MDKVKISIKVVYIKFTGIKKIGVNKVRDMRDLKVWNEFSTPHQQWGVFFCAYLE